MRRRRGGKLGGTHLAVGRSGSRLPCSSIRGPWLGRALPLRNTAFPPSAGLPAAEQAGERGAGAGWSGPEHGGHRGALHARAVRVPRNWQNSVWASGSGAGACKATGWLALVGCLDDGPQGRSRALARSRGEELIGPALRCAALPRFRGQAALDSYLSQVPNQAAPPALPGRPPQQVRAGGHCLKDA